MAIKATSFPSAGLLSEVGDGVDNAIVTSRDAAGQLFVNGGAVPINGGQATAANTSTIQVFGPGGNDTIALDESKGALLAAQRFGGAGNDTQDAILRDRKQDRANERPLETQNDTNEPAGQELNCTARISLDRDKMQIDGRMVNLSPGMAAAAE